MCTKQGQRLDILDGVAARQLVKHTQRVMVMHVRLVIESRLIGCIFPISSCVLEKHNGEDHVSHYSFCHSWSESWIIVPSSQLLTLVIKSNISWIESYHPHKGRLMEKRHVRVDNPKIPFSISNAFFPLRQFHLVKPWINVERRL